MRSVQHLKDDLTIEIAQDYFNEVDEATDCEEPKAKTVNLYRQVLQLYFILIFIYLSKRDPEALDGHVRPVSAIAWNTDGEQ